MRDEVPLPPTFHYSLSQKLLPPDDLCRLVRQVKQFGGVAVESELVKRPSPFLNHWDRRLSYPARENLTPRRQRSISTSSHLGVKNPRLVPKLC
jgi:hypothetical protein